MTVVFLDGDDIFLSPIAADDDLAEYSDWLNDQETTQFMGSGKFPANRHHLREYIDSFNRSNNGMLLGIYAKKSSKHIGNITLQQIDWINGFGEIGIVIGNKESRGKGYAIESIKLVAEHAFCRMNLRKLYAGVVSGNDASKRAFEKVGFQVEGVLREHFYLNGKYLDAFRMGLIKREYEGTNQE